MRGAGRICLAAVVCLLTAVGAARGETWVPLAGAVHVHTSEFSSGDHTLQELISMARERGVEVIVLTDHDRIAMSYGLPPFRNLFSWTLSRNSVLKRGAGRYLAAVDAADAAAPDVLLVPGLESAPFYYWSGSLRSGSLTVHDWRKHLHIVGIDRPEVLEDLPILENGFSTRYLIVLLPRFLLFAGLCLLSAILISWGGWLRTTGRLFLIVGILGIFDAQPFRSSRFDPFHGPQGAAPYQELIDYVSSQGGMIFWAHPEAHYGASEVVRPRSAAGIPLPTVRMETGIHPSDLVRTRGYTGFEALYGDTIHATDPGKEWDRVLTEYCRGERARPAWGLCGLDFHRQGQNSWSELDRGQTVFWVREKTRAAVLDAMRQGRMYSVFQGAEAKIRLNAFSLSGSDGKPAVSGETLAAAPGPLNVVLDMTMDDGSSVPLRVEVLDSGKIADIVEAETPLSLRRPLVPSRTKGYVRILVRAKHYRIVTNPIFYALP